MDNFRIAVKSFIINNKNKLLLIKRRENDSNAKGAWEIPGGRLELSENPYEGLKRETKEETNLDIEILSPLRIDHFQRDDKQMITMLIFLCKPLSDEIILSEEHTEYSWFTLEEAKEKIHYKLTGLIDIYERYFEGK